MAMNSESGSNRRNWVNRFSDIISVRLFLANFSSLALSLVNIKVLSTFLSVDKFATWALIITFQSFATFILTGPLRVGLTRYHASALAVSEDASYRRFAFSAFFVSALISIFCAVMVVNAFDFGSSITIQGVVFAVLYGVILDYSSFLSLVAQQMAHVWRAIFLLMLGKLALLAGVALSFIKFDVSEGVSELGLLAGTVSLSVIKFDAPEPEIILPLTVLVFSVSLFILRCFSCESSLLCSFFVGLKWDVRIPAIMRFGWVFVVTGLISWTQMSMPRYLLSWYQSPEEVACFFLVTQIALLSMATLTAVIGQTISPKLYIRHDDIQLPGLPSPWQFELVGGAGLAIFTALVAIIFSLVAGDWVVKLVSREGFDDISELLAISFATYGLYSVAQVMRIYGDQIKRPQIYLVANIVYPLVAVVLSFLAVRHGLIFFYFGLLTAEVIHLVMITVINQIQYNYSRART